MIMNVFKMYYYRKKFIFKNIRQFFRNVKYAWQRATRGFADCDAWSVDWFLRNVFKGALEKLANTTHSYPETFDNIESWQNELKRIARLVAMSDIDDRINECYDSDEWLDREKYGKIILECKANQDEVFDWLKDNFNNLWD